MHTSSLFSSLHFTRRLLLGLFCSLAAVAALADPSVRVGRIAYLEGDVQFRAAEQVDAAQASVNWPLTGGNRITTAPNARTEIRVGSSVIRLDGQSELLITALDDDRLALYLPYGSATVRIRNAEVAREFSLQTPQGQVSLLQPGRFRIDAGRNAPTTSLHVIDGTARFDTPQSSRGGQPALIVAAGGRLDSDNGFSQITSLRAPAANDGFDGWSLARDRNDDRSQSVRYVSAETTGYEELDRNGVWRTTADYGPVWTPTVVTADWAPYRYGRWTWVAPWGWTWVDNASWGYAPSHYGRWVSIDNRWCWAPGAVVARPVWAPAVVGWQGGVDFHHASWAQRPPTTGWFPLAPREVYVPSYAVSRTYVERVNINHVTNVTQINNFYRSRDDDRGHADRSNYRYRALANNVVPAAAGAPAVAAPLMAPARSHQEGQRFEAAGGGALQRQPAAVAPVQPLQAQQPPHREQSGYAGRRGHDIRNAPIPAPPPAAPIQIPTAPSASAGAAPSASAPVATPTSGPSPAEHHPRMGGRGQHDGQRGAPPAMPAPAAAPAATVPTASLPPVALPRQVAPAATSAAPAARPQHHERHEGREPHEPRETRERNEGRERR